MMNCNTTIYRIEYVPKSIKNLKADREKFKLKNIIQRDPIADSYKKYLFVNDDDATARSEALDKYYEKAKDTYPWFDKVTENEPVDKSIIEKNRIFRGKTVYQVDFCDLEKDNAYKEYVKRTAVKLPLDIEIPLTTQKSGYRNPKMLDSKIYEKIALPKPQNNLKVDEKQREILHVTTGDSEYMGLIGKLGKQIIEEELHGIITHYSY